MTKDIKLDTFLNPGQTRTPEMYLKDLKTIFESEDYIKEYMGIVYSDKYYDIVNLLENFLGDVKSLEEK